MANRRQNGEEEKKKETKDKMVDALENCMWKAKEGNSFFFFCTPTHSMVEISNS